MRECPQARTYIKEREEVGEEGREERERERTNLSSCQQKIYRDDHGPCLVIRLHFGGRVGSRVHHSDKKSVLDSEHKNIVFFWVYFLVTEGKKGLFCPYMCYVLCYGWFIWTEVRVITQPQDCTSSLIWNSRADVTCTFTMFLIYFTIETENVTTYGMINKKESFIIWDEDKKINGPFFFGPFYILKFSFSSKFRSKWLLYKQREHKQWKNASAAIWKQLL